MTDVYKFAAQFKLRFPSCRGDLTAEQLFQVPLRSTTGFDLNEIAKAVNADLKAAGEESFVEEAAADPRKQTLTVMLDVVKDVIATKQAEAKAARDKLEKAAQRKKILDVIAAKKDEKLTAASLDELEKQLAALDA